MYFVCTSSPFCCSVVRSDGFRSFACTIPWLKYILRRTISFLFPLRIGCLHSQGSFLIAIVVVCFIRRNICVGFCCLPPGGQPTGTCLFVGWLVANSPFISHGLAMPEDGTALKVLLSAMLQVRCCIERGDG